MRSSSVRLARRRFGPEGEGWGWGWGWEEGCDDAPVLEGCAEWA